MITVNKGEVKIEGSAALLLAELSCTVKSLNEALTEKHGEEEAKERIMMAVEDGFKSGEVIREEALGIVKEFMESMLKDLFGGE